MAIGCIDGSTSSFALCTLSSYTFHPDKQAGSGFRHQRSAILRELSVHGATRYRTPRKGAYSFQPS